MSRFTFTSALLITISLFFVTACGEQNAAPENNTPASSGETSKPAKKKPKRVTKTDRQTAKQKNIAQDPVMNQPVDFSSPERIENSLENIQQQAGEDLAGRVTGAIGYLLVYDLSVSHNKEKLYKKLNGRTPNEIIAMADR